MILLTHLCLLKPYDKLHNFHAKVARKHVKAQAYVTFSSPLSNFRIRVILSDEFLRDSLYGLS